MVKTNSLGIFQGDVLIRAAVIQGLRELRKNPLLLDYCFAWLPNDELTADTYGLRTVEDAKRWFLATEINVSLDVRVGEAKLPMVSISLMDSAETQATLGDVHYDVAEDGPEDGTVTNLESVLHQESYNLGLYVEGEPEFLLFLHSIVLFILYRYKKDYLEARGFENSTVRVGRLSPVPDTERENLFGRPITLTGTVRHYWPALQGAKLTSVEGRILVSNPPDPVSPPSVKPDEQMWAMEDDILSGLK